MANQFSNTGYILHYNPDHPQLKNEAAQELRKGDSFCSYAVHDFVGRLLNPFVVLVSNNLWNSR